jgi:hypothetical protein
MSDNDECETCCDRDAFDCCGAEKGGFCACDCHPINRRACDLCAEEADCRVKNLAFTVRGIVRDIDLTLCQSHKDRWDRRTSGGDA